jgi:hypothetical protein
MSMLYVHAACQCRMSMLHDSKWKRKVDAKQKLGSETKNCKEAQQPDNLATNQFFHFA